MGYRHDRWLPIAETIVTTIPNAQARPAAMTEAQVIVLATPVFLLLIAVEWAVGMRRGRNTYRLNDAMASIGLGVLSQLLGLYGKLAAVAIYLAVYDHVALTRLSASSPMVWLAALLVYDLCYYALHRAGHRVGVLWAAHVVHHQSEDYNLSTALRQTGSGFVFGWLFYLPMAVIGFPPLVFGVVALVDLLYQFWVHTQQIGRLGWFDRWFCSPSNHRVHHGVNDIYLDRNYGGILMVWDHLFGSFQDELDEQPVVYGTRTPLRSFNPLIANVEVYARLARDAARTRRWADKIAIWFKPPGWLPADQASAKVEFNLAARQRFDPPTSRAAALASGGLFAALLGATSLLLWHAHRLSATEQAAAVALIVAGLWSVGRWSQGSSEATVDTAATLTTQ
jgi:sterol desaturase/sphingolipid hydroxylase (fatty acid hydroxylase superfamily)